jgi:enoyl-CoA hydratase/carnithine racemase
MPFVSLGTCVEAAGSWLLPQRVGMQQASWMILSGRGLNATEAMANGFAFAASAPGQALDEALALAEQIAGHETAALVVNKRLIRQGWAEAIEQAWSRERAAMLELADQVGPIGWQADS